MTKEMLLEDHYIDDYVDDHVDREIESCFSASSPNNFFVFAGAGSGKTRSHQNEYGVYCNRTDNAGYFNIKISNIVN